MLSSLLDQSLLKPLLIGYSAVIHDFCMISDVGNEIIKLEN